MAVFWWPTEDCQKTTRKLPEDHQKTTRRPQGDNTEDYEQLKEEYLELHEDTKSQPKKNRKKLPKLKMNKNTKKLIRMVNRIIKTTSTDDMNIANINLIQYAGALLITNKITSAKPTTISFADDLGAFFAHFGQRSLLRSLGQSSEIECNAKMNISFFYDLGGLSSHFGQLSLLGSLSQSEIEHNPNMNISFFNDLGGLF